MVQKIHPRGVIWVPSFRLMWADHQKKLTVVPSIYVLRSPCVSLINNGLMLQYNNAMMLSKWNKM